MQELTAIFEFIRGGGALAVVIVVGYGLVSGRLRLGREVERADAQLAECQEEVKIWRERVYPIVDRQQAILEGLRDRVNSNH